MNMIERVLGWLQAGAHVLDLAIRVYVAQVFFRSGLLKIGNWEGTLYLFENEYRVPLLPPEAAAWVGTFAELFFPVFLALGLAARFAATALFVFNIVAVVSFWHVLSENQAALNSHWYWGVLLAVTLLHGPGKLSLDHWIWKPLVLRKSAASARS
jgi:putative oxidoreductase